MSHFSESPESPLCVWYCPSAKVCSTSPPKLLIILEGREAKYTDECKLRETEPKLLEKRSPNHWQLFVWIRFPEERLNKRERATSQREMLAASWRIGSGMLG